MTLSERGRPRARRTWRRVYRARTLVGLAAGLVTVGTFTYSYLVHSLPTTGYGQVVTLVQDAKTGKAVTEASIEIVTEAGAVLTTMTSAGDGRAQHRVKEGAYTLRITHPRFGSESRKVYVTGGEISEVHVALAGRPAPREGDGDNPIQKFFRGLGL